MLAYVIIQLKESKEKEVFDDLQKFEEVKDVHILFGEFDLIAKIETKDTEELGDFVMEHIRDHPCVEHTKTLIIAK